LRKVKLSEIAEINGGSTPSTKNEEYWNGEIVWLSPSDLPEIGEIVRINDSERKITRVGLNNCSAKLLDPDTVIFSSRASIGKIAINDIPVATNQGFINFTCGNEIDKMYLAYVLKYFTEDIVQLSNSTTFKEVSKRAIKDFKIPLPSIEEQKAIVAKLDRAQRLIDIDKAMLAKYDQLIQSVFLDMFGDPVTNPKGWERVSFKKVAEIDKESFDPTEFKGNVEYVGLNSIVKDSGKIIDVETITEGDLKSNKYRFSSEHILYGKLRPYLNKVAFPDFSGVCSTDILPIKARDQISTKFFLGYLLKTKEFVNYADKNSSGANLPRISPTMVKKFEAYLPPFELQNKFDDLAIKIISEKKQSIKGSKKSEELFSSLMQEVFG